MSRNEGFVVADVATAKHNDPKFKALWRYLRDEQAMNAAVVLYEAVQLASWQHGERVTAEDAAPPWLTDIETPTRALEHVGLLDNGLLPERSWSAWFGAASERRQNLRDKWAKANRNRRQPKPDNAGTPQTPSGDNGGTAAPVRPSVPLNSSVTPLRAPRAEKIGSNDPDDEEGTGLRPPLSSIDPSLAAWERRH